jgi:hypothetical protein
MWREIRRYNVADGDGNVEEMILERNDKGVFRVRNDFGNINIEFDALSGTELFRNILEDIGHQIEDDLNDIWDSLDDITEEDDCDGDYNG